MAEPVCAELCSLCGQQDLWQVRGGCQSRAEEQRWQGMLTVTQGHPLLKQSPAAASSWRLPPGAPQPLSFPRGGVKKHLFTYFPPLQKQAKNNGGFFGVYYLNSSFFSWLNYVILFHSFILPGKIPVCTERGRGGRKLTGQVCRSL